MSKASIMDKLVFMRCEWTIPIRRAFPCVTASSLPFARRLERDPGRTAVGRRDAERDAGAVPDARGTCSLSYTPCRTRGASYLTHLACGPVRHLLRCGYQARCRRAFQVRSRGSGHTESSSQVVVGREAIGRCTDRGGRRARSVQNRGPGSARSRLSDRAGRVRVSCTSRICAPAPSSRIVRQALLFRWRTCPHSIRGSL